MRALADLLYPPLCVGCRRSARGGLCEDCLKAVPLIADTLCLHCGRPTVARVFECFDCRGARYRFDYARQAAMFEGVLRQAIHRFKYSTRRELVAPLAELIAPLLPEPAVVTWIPASRQRLNLRGVDHGRLLAETAAKVSGRACLPLLERVRETRPQMELPPRQRRRNLKGAFRGALDVPSEVVVVDDVFTTGTTASEAARALKASGAVVVSAVAVARGGAVSAGGSPPL